MSTEPQKSHPPRACSLTEPEAIGLAQKGNALGFERLYQLHGRRVYALCLRMVANTVEAEDLTQDAFLQLFRKIHTFRGESGFSTWLHRLTVNIVLMRFRKMKHAELSLDEPREPSEESARSASEPGADDLRLNGLLDRVNLARAVENLPDGYRQMFILHDVEGYEHNEIAELLGCSVGNSKSQLHKARLRMRQLLQEEARDRARRKREQASRKVSAAGCAEPEVPSGSQVSACAGPHRDSRARGRSWARTYRPVYAKA